MSIHIAQSRDTVVKQFVKLAGAFQDSAINTDMKLLATEGKAEGAILPSSLIPEDGLTINKVKIAKVDILARIAKKDCQEDITIRVGSHRAMACLVCSLENSVLDYVQIVDENTAQKAEIKSNLDHDLALRLDMLQKRKTALRLYVAGEFSSEVELRAKYGYNRIQSILAHKTAVMVHAYNCSEEKVLAITSQADISKGYKIGQEQGSLACQEYVNSYLVKKTVRMLSAKAIQERVDLMADGQVKDILLSILEGEKELFDDLTAEYLKE